MDARRDTVGARPLQFVARAFGQSRSTADLVKRTLAHDGELKMALVIDGTAGTSNATALIGSHITRLPFAELDGHAGEEGPLLVSDAPLAGDSERALFRQLYRFLPENGQLVLVLDEPSTTPTSRSRRDLVSAGLFAEGFVGTRMWSTREHRLVVAAERGAADPPQQREQQLSVVMPVYNERETFRKVIEELLAKSIDGLDIEVIIVESNSSDGTRDEVIAFADHPRVRVVLEERARGKGHAVRAGFAAARGDYLLIQDADLEYDLDDYPAIIEPLRNFSTGFVLGARLRTKGARWGVRHFEKEVLTSWAMNVGNVVFLSLFNAVYRQHLEDPFTMYKAIRRDCLNGLRLECDRFDFDWELTAKLIRSGFNPIEIPVSYQSRSFGEGKKIAVLRDPLSWIVACFKYRFARLES